MKKKTTISFTLAVFGLFLNGLQAQISSRTDQFFLDPSAINPSAILLQKNKSLNLFYNKTFTGVTGAPENVIANLVMPFKSKNTGFGIYYLRERAGFQQLHNAYASYAYGVPIGDESQLCFGASLGILSQSFDASKAVYIQTNDPVIRSLSYSPTANRADFRASLMLQAGGFNGGIAFSRLANPRFDYSYYNYKASYSLQSLTNLYLSYNIAASESFMIKPSLLFNFYDYKYTNFRMNISAFIQEKFWAGINTDASSQIGFNIGLKAANAVTFGYSANFMSGKIKGVLGPVHEFYTSFPFGGGSGSDDEEEETPDRDEVDNPVDKPEDKPAEPLRRLEKITVNSFNDLKNAPNDLDTAGITINPLKKEDKQPGIYLVCGMYPQESKANEQIKSLYLKGIAAYKFYDPVNHNYYVWIKQFKSMAEASAFVQNTDNAHLPEAWIRVVK